MFQQKRIRQARRANKGTQYEKTPPWLKYAYTLWKRGLITAEEFGDRVAIQAIKEE